MPGGLEMPPASPAVGPNPQPPPQGIERLATLVHLERRARGAGTLAELGFVLVNETIGLVAYRQAVLLGRARRGREILAMSGIPEPASDAPFPVWIRAVLRHLDADPEPKCRAVTAADLPAALAADWGAWLPAFLIVVPLRRQGLAFGVLALAREDPPTGADLRILGMATCWFNSDDDTIRLNARIRLLNAMPVVSSRGCTCLAGGLHQWRKAGHDR